MLLLVGKSLEPELRFTPISMSLNLVDAGVSTAAMTLGPDEPELDLGRWLQDDTEPGKGIVWRVKSVDTAWETGTRTVQLEHIVATLRDSLIFGETGSKDKSISAKSAIQTALSKQDIWTLGTFEYSRSLPYSFNNATVYSAIESVCSTLEDSRWEYDLSKLPFRLNIVKKSSGVASEMRASRNLQTIRRTVDMTGMYTRFYPVGARNLHISGDYVHKNSSVYGVISRTETDQSIESETMLREWALHRLRRHCEPTVTITIKGLDLSQSTGEPLDSLTMGRMCRVPLPEYNTTISQYIIRLSWSDKIRAPEDVTVTLSNHRTDATTNLAQALKQMSSSHSHNSGGGAKAAAEDHAWIVDTTDKVGLVAEAIVGRDPDGNPVDWSRVSEIIVDGEGIHQRVTATEGELVVAESRIEMNENGIRLESERAMGEEGKLAGKLSVTAEAITAEVTRATEAEGELSGRLTVEADRITAEVTRATEAEGELSGRLTVTSEAITAEVTRATAAEGDLSGRLTVTSEAITAEVTRATAAEGTLDGRLTVEAGRITAEVSRATEAEGTLATRITQTSDKVSIIATDKEIEDFIKSGGEGSIMSVTKDSVTSAVGRITTAEGNIATITGSTLWQTRDSIAAVAGKMRVSSKGNLLVEEGAQLKVSKDGVYETVGTVKYTDDQISAITGTALWRDKDRIAAVAGKMRVSSKGNLLLEEGAQLYVTRDGVYETVGTVKYTDDQISAITGTALWRNRDSITTVAGKMSVDKNGNLVVEDGAELKVYSDGTLRSVTALAGKVKVTNAGNVVVDGATLYVKDDQGHQSDVTAVAGKFTVTKAGNVVLQDGTGLFVRRDSTNIEVVDKGTVITSIRASKEGVKIQASKVDLGDYATVGQLDAVSASIDNLMAGGAIATHLLAKDLTVNSSYFMLGGKKVTMESKTFVSSVSLTKPSISLTSNKNFMYANTYHGEYDSTSSGCLVTSFSAGSLSVSTSTIYYLRHTEVNP